MKSRCSSVKATQRRPFLRSLALVLSVVVLFSVLGIGSIISANALETAYWEKYTWTCVTGSFESSSSGTYYIPKSSSGWADLSMAPVDDFFKGEHILKTAKTSSDEDPYQYYFAYRLGGTNDGGWTNKARPTVAHTFTATPGKQTWDYLGNGSDSDPYYTLNVLKSETGYTKVLFAFWPKGSQSYITQTAVENLSISDSSFIAGRGSKVSAHPTISGGSGHYSVSYTSLKLNGNSVTPYSDYITSDKLSVGTNDGDVWTITGTVSDTYCPDLASVSFTETVTVGDVDYYFVSGETNTSSNTSGTWDRLPEYKFTKVNSDEYTLKVYLKNGYKFLIEDMNGNQCGHSTTNDYNIASIASSINTNASVGNRYVWNTTEGYYTITFKPHSKTVAFSSIATETFFLTGYYNKRTYSTLSDKIAFTPTDTDNVYTYTTIFWNDHNNSQYITVTSSNAFTAYHSAESHTGSGTSAHTSTDNAPGADNMWQVGAVANSKVTFTWDMSTSPYKLSWVINPVSYTYTYTGRNGQITYTCDGTPLTSAEFGASQTPNTALNAAVFDGEDYNRRTEIINNVPNVKIFNKTVNFGTSTWSPTAFSVTVPATITDTTYNLNVYSGYINETGGTQASLPLIGTIPGTYNTTVDLTAEALTSNENENYQKSENDSIATLAPDGKVFYGWKEYNASTGAVSSAWLSTQANFGYSLTDDLTIVAVFGNPVNGKRPSLGTTWGANVDKNYISYDNDGTDDIIYNDSIIRFTYSGDSSKQITDSDPNITECGVIILAQTGTGKTANSSNFEKLANQTQLKNYLRALSTVRKGKMNEDSYGEAYAFMIKADNLSVLNRADMCQILKYDKFIGGQYILAAYYKIGNEYTVSDSYVLGNYSPGGDMTVLTSMLESPAAS